MPAKNCGKLDTLSRRFWWELKDKDSRFIAWNAWDKLCRPKRQGGLGFKKAKDVNSALLAKLAWMVVSGKQSFCMEVLRTKYKVSNNWITEEPVKLACPTWRAIEAGKNLIEKGACFLLGDGKSIDIWIDQWVPWIANFKPQPRVEEYKQFPIKAFQLIDSTSRSWNVGMGREIFIHTDAHAILTIPIPFTPKQDRLIWLPDSKGVFSVKSVYKVAFNHPTSN